MLARFFTIILITASVPALAQRTAPVNPVQFVQHKTGIDSLVQIADTLSFAEHAVFNGKARQGRYRVECFYSTPHKEIIRANYLIITDSLNYSRTYYFKGNKVVKIYDNNAANYYSVEDKILTEQGSTPAPATSKIFADLIADTFQGLYAALFPNK